MSGRRHGETRRAIAARAGRPYPERLTAALDLRELYGPEVDIACGAVEPAVDRWEASGRRRRPAASAQAAVTGRHLDPRPRPSVPLRTWLARAYWLGWASAAALYGWLAHEVAELGLPDLVVLLTVLSAAYAFTAGHVLGARDTD